MTQQYKFKVYGNQVVDTESLSREEWIDDTCAVLRVIDQATVSRVLRSEGIERNNVERIRYDYLDGSRVPAQCKAVQDAFRSQRTTDIFVRGKKTPIRAVVVLRFDPEEQAFATNGNLYVNETFGGGRDGYFSRVDGERVYSLFE